MYDPFRFLLESQEHILLWLIGLQSIPSLAIILRNNRQENKCTLSLPYEVCDRNDAEANAIYLSRL
jgi:hypothetical protein